MVVNDYFIGKTHVCIHDDHCCKSEDIPTIMNRLVKTATKALQSETDKTYIKTTLLIKGGNH